MKVTSFLNQSLGLMFLSLPSLKGAFIVLKCWEENCSFPENQIHSSIFQVWLLPFFLGEAPGYFRLLCSFYQEGN